MVATEELFLTFIIDTMEHQEVETVDIPRALMKEKIEGETGRMKMEGTSQTY